MTRELNRVIISALFFLKTAGAFRIMVFLPPAEKGNIPYLCMLTPFLRFAERALFCM